jgi:hypothetical protein
MERHNALAGCKKQIRYLSSWSRYASGVCFARQIIGDDEWEIICVAD